MNNELFENIISSYRFVEKKLPDEMSGLFKYYELKFDKTKSSPDLTLYWYDDETFSLYRNEGFAAVKLCDYKLNLYNLKLAIEKNMTEKQLRGLMVL